MAYQSKYTGLQIDDILDSVEYKQSKIEDLASIRAGAQKGATALQSYTEKYTGTVTGIKINGVVKSGSGVIDLGTIESKTLTESDIAAMGFTKNSGTYSKPSTGIPKSDLASAVQTSLDKADTALQSYTEQYKGTATGVQFYGTQYDADSSGIVQMGYPDIGAAREIKVDGGIYSPIRGQIDLGYINKQLSTSTSSSMTLSPNIYYRNTSTSLSTLTITLSSVSNSNIINEYFVEFTTRSAGTTVSLPSTIKWANGEAPTFEASTTYQISIVNNLGVVTKFK